VRWYCKRKRGRLRDKEKEKEREKQNLGDRREAHAIGTSVGEHWVLRREASPRTTNLHATANRNG
jgi:hypothetical protein